MHKPSTRLTLTQSSDVPSLVCPVLITSCYVKKIPGSPCDTYSCWGEPGNEATRNHMWQSHVEIENFSVKYVDRNSLFEAPYC